MAMPLQCPECEAAALRIKEALELGPDARSDEVSLQIVRCGACGLETVAVYEESRRGALDREQVNHTAYPATDDAMAEIARLIRSCTRPKDGACRCGAHTRAREIVRLRTGPSGIDWARALPILFARK